MPSDLVRGNIGGLIVVSVTINPAEVATITTAEQTFTVDGLRASDLVIAVIKPTCTAGVGIVNARVSAANTLALTFVNPTAAGVDAASESYKIVIARPSGGGTGTLPTVTF